MTYLARLHFTLLASAGMLLLVIACAFARVALAHGPEARLVEALDWRRAHITRAFAVNRSELGLNGWKIPAVVKELDGQQCIVGALAAFDVDDTFAFDI